MRIEKTIIMTTHHYCWRSEGIQTSRWSGLLGLALVLTLGPAHEARSETLGWVDFSGYVVGAQSQCGLSSTSGLQICASFSNLDNVNTVEVPSPAPASATIDDPSWPFENVAVSGVSIAPALLGGGPPISNQLTFQFTNPGGLAAGGAIAVMDLEFGAQHTVTIAGLSGGSPVPVTWSFASYSVLGDDVAPPVWNPTTQTLSGPGDFSNPAGFPNNFVLLTSDRQLDAVVLTLAVNEGLAFGVAQVPDPATLLLLGTGLAMLGARRGFRRRAEFARALDRRSVFVPCDTQQSE